MESYEDRESGKIIVNGGRVGAGQMEKIYHVFRLLGEESDGARAVTLNILFDETHAC